MSNCYACNKAIKAAEKITCLRCETLYHHLCVSITASSYKKLTKEEKLSWTCPKCRIASPRPRDNLDIPLSSTSGTSDNTSQGPEEDSIRIIVRQELKLAFKNELPSLLRGIMKSELGPLKQELDELQKSCNFISDKQDELVSSLNKVTDDNKFLQARCEALSDTVLKLNYEINTLQQDLRESNLELNGIPENRAEHLPSLLQQCARAVAHSIDESDILKCTRVAKIKKDDTRPRAIVVKLKSPISRDQFYSAVTRYNKAHPEEKLNTAHLGIGGEKKPVFVNEHLSPYFKSVHAAARIKAKQLGYKFVWVRSGRIYMRKDEDARPVLIKNIEALNLVK